MKHGLSHGGTLALPAGSLRLGLLAGTWGGAALARITLTTTSIMEALMGPCRVRSRFHRCGFRRLGPEGEPSEAWALLGSYVFRRVATVSDLAAAAIASAAFAALVTFRAAARRRAGRGS